MGTRGRVRYGALDISLRSAQRSGQEQAIGEGNSWQDRSAFGASTVGLVPQKRARGLDNSRANLNAEYTPEDDERSNSYSACSMEAIILPRS
jgi:hypothetical protein